MQIQVSTERCNACAVCVNICPCDVFRLDEKTGMAKAKYEEDCWYCGACEIDCPTQAISVGLPYLVA